MVTRHTGIPMMRFRGAYPPCTPSVTIVADKNPFCLGDSVTFTPTFNCVDDVTITAYAWIVDGAIVSTSADPYVSATLYNNARVGLLFVTSTGQNYFSNLIVMQEKTEGCITLIKYGLLYNWYAATDARNITSAGDFVFPTFAQWETLLNHIDTYDAIAEAYLVAGSKLKEAGTEYWIPPNDDATNEYNFNARGTGVRENDLWSSEFIGQLYVTGFYTNDNYPYGVYIPDNGSIIYEALNEITKGGGSIRLVRPATTPELSLADGTSCTPYVGNDGKVYRTVKIGTQVWLADNLAETKFRNGDYIHGYEGGSYQAISDAAWANLTDSALCAYNDDLNNV